MDIKMKTQLLRLSLKVLLMCFSIPKHDPTLRQQHADKMFVNETLHFKRFTYTLLVSVNLPHLSLQLFVKTQLKHTELQLAIFNKNITLQISCCRTFLSSISVFALVLRPISFFHSLKSQKKGSTRCFCCAALRNKTRDAQLLSQQERRQKKILKKRSSDAWSGGCVDVLKSRNLPFSNLIWKWIPTLRSHSTFVITSFQADFRKTVTMIWVGVSATVATLKQIIQGTNNIIQIYIIMVASSLL